MTDDRIVRMLRVSESDPVQQEAADEIERLRAELAAKREWRPMTTAPTDGTPILAALRVFSAIDKKFLCFDAHVVSLNDEGIAVALSGDDCGWCWEDFEVWKPFDISSIDAALNKGGGK